MHDNAAPNTYDYEKQMRRMEGYTSYRTTYRDYLINFYDDEPIGKNDMTYDYNLN